MTKDQMQRIRQLRKQGFTIAGIVRQTGMDQVAIARVLQEPHLLAQSARAEPVAPFRQGKVANA